MDTASDVEVEPTVLEITLNALSITFVFADVTEEVFPLVIYLSTNFFEVGIIEPHFRHPVDAGVMYPSKVGFCEKTFDIGAEGACNKIGGLLLILNVLASLTIPILIFVWNSIFYVFSITRLMYSNVT